MSRKATNISRAANRFIIVSPLLVEYQSERLIAACRTFSTLKDFQSLSETASLIEAPIGRYYEALAKNDWGAEPADFDIPGLYDKHRPRALLSIAQSLRHRGDASYALKLAVQSHALAISQRDWYTAGNAQREIAVDRSIAGDHRGALAVLEAGLPAVGSLRGNIEAAALCADYHNSLAVELGELGRIDEARRAVTIALASPFASAYPEWRDTLAGIEAHGRVDRSTVSFAICNLTSDIGNVVQLAPRACSEAQPEARSEPARILTFQKRVAAMVKKKEKETPTTPSDASSIREKELDLLRLLVDGEWDAEAINCITGVVQSSPRRRELIAYILSLPEEKADQLIKKLRS